MKKIASVLFVCMLVIALAGCSGNSNGHEDEAKTPSGSIVQKGRGYQEVVNDFKGQGFKNIKTEKLEDLITGWMTKEGEVESVSVDGNKDYSPDVWYPNDIEVIITYHAFPKDKKKTESTATSSTEQKVPQQNKHDEAAKATLESTFPIENAKRAAVVAITNSFATDVFKADRLILKNILGTVANGSLDVKYDGKKYIVSNVKGTFGKDLDLSEIEKEKNASLFLAVSPELIKNDRNQREVNALD